MKNKHSQPCSRAAIITIQCARWSQTCVLLPLANESELLREAGEPEGIGNDEARERFCSVFVIFCAEIESIYIFDFVKECLQGDEASQQPVGAPFCN